VLLQNAESWISTDKRAANDGHRNACHGRVSMLVIWPFDSAFIETPYAIIPQWQLCRNSKS
jgi:hypothetical protein